MLDLEVPTRPENPTLAHAFLLALAVLFARSAGAAPECEIYLAAPFGLKRTSAMILGGSDAPAGAGLERLRAFVRRARPDRREVADHVARVLLEIERSSYDSEADHVAESFLTYVMRSPRLAPEYLEAITAALFARFRIAEGADLAQRDLGRLEDALDFYLGVAARQPKLAAAHFKSHLDVHLLTFAFDEVRQFYDLVDRSYSTEFADSASSIALARDSVSATHAGLPHTPYVVAKFWLRLVAKVANTLPGLSNHQLLRASEHLRARLLQIDEVAAKDLADVRAFERASADVSDWSTGNVAPDREVDYQRWVYYGRPDDLHYYAILRDRAQALQDPEDPNPDVELESESVSRARRAANFPVDSAAHRHLTNFAGPNVKLVERGRRALPVPERLKALVPDLPDRLHFPLAHHYDEHVWERAEVRRSSPSFLRRRPPEYVVDLFERLLVQIQAANQDPSGPRVGRTLLDEATQFLNGVKDGLARKDSETTAWSVPKRNEMLELLGEAEWNVLEGKASTQSNVLLQANVKGTRFNLAVCVREPCTGTLRIGGVASIYPVCGPGVFLVPRASKIIRTLARMKDSDPKANKDFREGLVKAKPCPK